MTSDGSWTQPWDSEEWDELVVGAPEPEDWVRMPGEPRRSSRPPRGSEQPEEPSASDPRKAPTLPSMRRLQAWSDAGDDEVTGTEVRATRKGWGRHRTPLAVTLGALTGAATAFALPRAHDPGTVVALGSAREPAIAAARAAVAADALDGDGAEVVAPTPSTPPELTAPELADSEPQPAAAASVVATASAQAAPRTPPRATDSRGSARSAARGPVAAVQSGLTSSRASAPLPPAATAPRAKRELWVSSE